MCTPYIWFLFTFTRSPHLYSSLVLVCVNYGLFGVWCPIVSPNVCRNFFHITHGDQNEAWEKCHINHICAIRQFRWNSLLADTLTHTHVHPYILSAHTHQFNWGRNTKSNWDQWPISPTETKDIIFWSHLFDVIYIFSQKASSQHALSP